MSFRTAACASAVMLGFPAACGGSIDPGSTGLDGGVGSSSGLSSGSGGGSSGGHGSSDTVPDALGQPDPTNNDGSSVTDVALAPLDAALASLDAAPTGLAGFAFIVNHVVQHPMDCPGTDWEFAPYPESGIGPDGGPTGDIGGCADSCSGSGGWGPISVGSCPGVQSVLLLNTGALDMAYIAGPCWNVPAHTAYAPGGYPGGEFLAGVLAPGAYVDITTVYNGGITALVGSAEPFSARDASYASDEGQVPWPLGVNGSGGATTMYVAEIEVRPACQAVTSVW